MAVHAVTQGSDARQPVPDSTHLPPAPQSPSTVQLWPTAATGVMQRLALASVTQSLFVQSVLSAHPFPRSGALAHCPGRNLTAPFSGVWQLESTQAKPRLAALTLTAMAWLLFERSTREEYC
ncbi:MAG TPA: hypothetical protein VMU34_21445 [Mycobacterium sp.]|nr:hypothetical protein [Mycobacterium sp.]